MGPTAEDKVVDLIYAAALDPALWPTAMASVADSVGGTISALSRLDITDADGESIISRSDPSSLELYLHYQAKNVFTLVDRPAAFVRGWKPSVLTEANCLDWDDYQRSDYCNGFMRPQGVNAALFIQLELSDTKITKLNIGRSIRAGRFEGDQLETAARLQPHLIRAYKFGRAIAVARSPERELSQLVHASEQAVFLIDDGGFVRLTNSAGERLLAAGKGLTVLGGRLVARHSESARRLEQLIGAATQWHGQQMGGAMSLPLPGHRFPLALRVNPVATAAIPAFGIPRTALVCVTDLETAVNSPERELRAMFGLTYAESRVATAIFDGLSMREASEQLGVALNTVRFQLARVYEKTGVTRQAELVKMMMRLSTGAGES